MGSQGGVTNGLAELWVTVKKARRLSSKGNIQSSMSINSVDAWDRQDLAFYW